MIINITYLKCLIIKNINYLTYLVNNKKYINKSNDLYLFIIIRKNYIIYNNLIGKLKTHNY